VAAAAVVLTSFPFAQTAAEPDASRLRTLFFGRDYETGVLEGRRLTSRFTGDTQAHAWYLLNLARRDEADEAIRVARALVTDQPKDPSAWIALGGALHYKGGQTAEAIEAAGKAFAMLPDHPDAIWLRAQTLAGDPKRREEAIEFVDGQRGRVRNPAEILATRGYTLYVLSSGQPRDEAKLAAALASFEEARRVDPANVNALYLPAVYLTQLRRSHEAYPLLRKALEISPGSTDLHRGLWNAITSHREFDAARKRREIEEDIATLLKRDGDRPGVLLAVSSIARELKLAETQQQAEEKILKEFADTREAEWVCAARWREFGRTSESARDPEYRRILTDFIARPRHYHTGLLGEAYRNLFFIVAEDRSVSGDELYRLADGVVKHENNNPHITFSRVPIALAERKMHLRDAERIAREGIEVLRKRVESRRSTYRTQGEYEESLQWMTGLGHDALGWVLFAQGRMEEAEKELLRAHELDHDNRENLNHLGRFYEATDDISKAEEYYVLGLSVQGTGRNPSEASLKALYAKRNGSEEGFDAYLTRLKESDRETREARILSERIDNADVAPSFKLKSLNGQVVTLESLKGKVAVINFWGIWCGWCVREMPDFQKLYVKYRDDPEVAILTIDNDENPDEVPPWMKEKGYTFPVLLDDGYVSDTAEIRAFPTTWFLDREGRKAFVKIGWSEKLLEEFSWRVEALRGSPSPASR
jgi:Flp pilus assembly protein TadD/thiol-disulfide isomerase/thioredoxin